MSDSAKPQFPGYPDYYQNPAVATGIEFLSDIGQGLATGQFFGGGSTPAGRSLSFLSPLVSVGSPATQAGLNLATGRAEDVINRQRQGLINQLEANNQLTSSTAVSRLSDLNEAFNQDIADMATQFYIADVERAMSNTMNLFGTGLNTVGSATQFGLSEQGQRNEFNQNQYANEVALEAERYNRQVEREIATSRGLGLLSPVSGIGYGIAKGNPQAATTGGLSSIQLASNIIGTILGAKTGNFGGASNNAQAISQFGQPYRGQSAGTSPIYSPSSPFNFGSREAQNFYNKRYI